MGREATISYEQVAAAADTMKATGSKPTSRAIRERIGNIGSMGTINRHLQAWRAGQERQIASTLSLPAALQRSILDFMGQELAAARAVERTVTAFQIIGDPPAVTSRLPSGVTPRHVASRSDGAMAFFTLSFSPSNRVIPESAR